MVGIDNLVNLFISGLCILWLKDIAKEKCQCNGKTLGTPFRCLVRRFLLRAAHFVILYFDCSFLICSKMLKISFNFLHANVAMLPHSPQSIVYPETRYFTLWVISIAVTSLRNVFLFYDGVSFFFGITCFLRLTASCVFNFQFKGVS